MGLLDFMNTDEGMQGMGLLAAAAPSMAPMNLAGRIAMAGKAYKGMQDDELKNKLTAAQLDNYRSEIEARKLAGIKDARMQALIGSVFGAGGIEGATGGGGMAGGGASPGAFTPSADGMGPTMPQAMQAKPGGVMANMSADTVARLKLGGLDLTELWKTANDPQKFEQGSTYRDRNTGVERTILKTDNGMMDTGNGFYDFAPGYAAAQAKAKGLEAKAVAEAQSRQKVREVYDPVTQTTKLQTEQQVIDAATPGAAQPPTQPNARVARPLSPMSSRPGEADREMIFNQEMKAAQGRLQLSVTPEQITRAKADIDSLGREMKAIGMTAQPQQVAQSGPMAAGPSAGQVISNKFGEKMVEKQADILDKSYTSASDAASNLKGIFESRKAMQSGAFQGTGADLKLSVFKFGQSIGIKIDPEKVANTDYLKSTLGEGLLEKAKTLGSNPSNADASRITDIVGSIGKDPNAMSRILDWQQEMSQRSITKHNERVGQAIDSGLKPQFDLKVNMPTEDASKSQARTASLADIAATAKASGKTTAEVTAAMKAKGFKIGGQ